MEDYHRKILADYLDADFNKRLHIFLDHRSLRSEFLFIDQNERQIPNIADDTSLKKYFRVPLNVAFALVSNGFKKILSFESIKIYSERISPVGINGEQGGRVAL